jgi:hypothetical protein
MNYSTTFTYQYQLEKGGKKHRCPKCQQRTFTRYIDTSTGERLPETLGRCDREQKCQYWSKPTRSELGNPSVAFLPVKMPTPTPPSYISEEVMAISVKHGQNSAFARWLIKRFGADLAADVIRDYHLGASKHWDGANVFWQVDYSGHIHAGKIMQYDETGHRVKTPSNRITWVHSALKIENYNLNQCFYGEHLLTSRSNAPVAIVESEKTAIVSSLYFPSIVWIATGGKNGCKWKTDTTVTHVLNGRKVVLFPDLGAFEDWQQMKIRLCEAGAQVKVNELLENNASENERKNGLDLADYLMRFEPHQFTNPNTNPPMNSHSSTVFNWDAINTPEPWEINPF